MTVAVHAPIARPERIPVRDVLPWIVFAPFLLMAIYFVGMVEGASSLVGGMAIHEFLHDSRHLLGFPCH